MANDMTPSDPDDYSGGDSNYDGDNGGNNDITVGNYPNDG